MDIKIVYVLVDENIYKEMVEIDGEYIDFRWDTHGIIGFVYNDKLITYELQTEEIEEMIKSASALPADAKIIS